MTIRWRFTGGKTPTYLKEKYHRSFIYGNSARTKLKSLFPPLKCSHLQPGFCQIHNSSQFGPEKTFSFCSWGYCANKTLFFKAGKLCCGHQCRCETQRALKSFSYGSRSSSSDTMLPVITIILTTDLTESLEILGRLGLELGQEIRCKILEGSCKVPDFLGNQKDLPHLHNNGENSESSMAPVLQNQRDFFCYVSESKK